MLSFRPNFYIKLSSATAATLILIFVFSLVNTIWAGNQFADPIVNHPSAIVYGTAATIDFDIDIPQNETYTTGMGIGSWKLLISSPDFSQYFQIYDRDQSFYNIPESFEWGGGYILNEAGDDYISGLFPVGTYQVYLEVNYVWFNIVNGLAHVNSELGEKLTYTGTISVVATEDDLNPSPTPTPTVEPTLEPSSTPSPSPSTSVTPTPSPTPTPTSEDDVLSEKYSKLHPVLFIHGLASYPEMWRDAEGGSDYVSMLRQFGYPREYLSLYTYSGEGVGINGYNNQGHISIAALGMYAKIRQLSELSIKHGGDGKVDIVAHSMGGLIARQYLSVKNNSPMINKVISIATPYRGSWFMDTYNNMDVKTQLFLSALALPLTNLNLYNPAPQDMASGSQFYLSTKVIEGDSGVKYFNLYGSIGVNFIYNLFNLNLINYTNEYGDLVVSDTSAKNVPDRVTTSYKYEEDTNIDITIRSYWDWNTMSMKYIPTQSNLGSLRYFHTSIQRQDNVKMRISSILTKN